VALPKVVSKLPQSNAKCLDSDSVFTSQSATIAWDICSKSLKNGSAIRLKIQNCEKDNRRSKAKETGVRARRKATSVFSDLGCSGCFKRLGNLVSNHTIGMGLNFEFEAGVDGVDGSRRPLGSGEATCESLSNLISKPTHSPGDFTIALLYTSLIQQTYHSCEDVCTSSYVRRVRSPDRSSRYYRTPQVFTYIHLVSQKVLEFGTYSPIITYVNTASWTL
jgi:hypothetical protein